MGAQTPGFCAPGQFRVHLGPACLVQAGARGRDGGRCAVRGGGGASLRRAPAAEAHELDGSRGVPGDARAGAGQAQPRAQVLQTGEGQLLCHGAGNRKGEELGETGHGHSMEAKKDEQQRPAEGGDPTFPCALLCHQHEHQFEGPPDAEDEYASVPVLQEKAEGDATQEEHERVKAEAHPGDPDVCRHEEAIQHERVGHGEKHQARHVRPKAQKAPRMQKAHPVVRKAQ
mmetsp:Transcript_92385/g.265758  ORF Transcript_92385/g.265758 Transcript_92385/m.265758 type:complete len:229 (-) Transcript_92385:148-834(-)